MSAMPKILPLLAVATAGVLAYKGLANAQVLPDLFAPRAAAEEASRPAKPARPGQSQASLQAGPAAAAVPPPVAVCQRSAADLAKEAGLSPAELATLQNLGARRGQLDAREQAMDTQLQLINAASAKLDGKLTALSGLKGQIQALLGQADQQSQTEIDRLVLVYEKMKPRDAGALMAALDDKVRVPVAAKISETKPAVLAAILSQMGTAEGKKLTELLARRYTPAQTLQQALSGAPAPPSTPAEAAAAATKAAQADAPADGASATASAQAGASPGRTSRRARASAQARRKPAKPVQTAKATTPAKPLQTAAAPAAAAPKPLASTPAPSPVAAPAKPG